VTISVCFASSPGDPGAACPCNLTSQLAWTRRRVADWVREKEGARRLRGPWGCPSAAWWGNADLAWGKRCPSSCLSLLGAALAGARLQRAAQCQRSNLILQQNFSFLRQTSLKVVDGTHRALPGSRPAPLLTLAPNAAPHTRPQPCSRVVGSCCPSVAGPGFLAGPGGTTCVPVPAPRSWHPPQGLPPPLLLGLGDRCSNTEHRGCISRSVGGI